ncbi:hypothetical protein ECDEC14C_1717, partial [Escherichia coli DEC14C]
MRKSFNGLGEQIQHVLDDNPFSGHLFIFRGRTGETRLKMYAIENEIRRLPESERLAARQQRSKALLTSLHEWMVEKNGTLSKKSRLGEAFSYVLNQWDALCYYSDDGLAEVDNNTAERALRAVCLGKK